MARRLNQPNATGGSTDHSEEVSWLWTESTKQSDRDRQLEFMLAAELLQCHDETGISLDDWPVARQFVERRLAKDIIPNLI